MKKLFFVMATIGICYIMPAANAMSNAISAETYTCIQANADPKVGDYEAMTGSGSSFKSINIAVYSYANSCYSYYAIIDGEKYAVRKNPDYTGSHTSGYSRAHTHYVQYKNDRYYFSI